MNDITIAKKLLSKQANAKQRGIPFSLSFADTKRLMTRKTCYYTGVKLTQEGENQRTFDRIDSTKGYTKENTIVCTYKVNCLKNRLLEELGVSLTVVKRIIAEMEANGVK